MLGGHWVRFHSVGENALAFFSWSTVPLLLSGVQEPKFSQSSAMSVFLHY